MFRQHATVLTLPLWRSASVLAAKRAAAFNNSPSNDNRPGFRRPPGQCRRPKPALDCHWIEVNGRLECRWTLADGKKAPGLPREPRATDPIDPQPWPPARGALKEKDHHGRRT
jgi:hypothetical protein